MTFLSDDGHLNHARLIDGKVVPCSLMEWAKWLESHRTERIIRQTKKDDTLVSTVFLGLDHGFGGRPQWFETMVFKDDTGGADLDMHRYETLEEAKSGHEIMCDKYFGVGNYE